MNRRETPSAKAIRLLKEQWAATMAAELREVADSLPEGHHERPGLIRAAEIVHHYGHAVR